MTNGQTVFPFEYFVKSTGTNLATAKSLIQAAIKEIQESSCVQWVPRKDERFYVKFEGKEYEGWEKLIDWLIDRLSCVWRRIGNILAVLQQRRSAWNELKFINFTIEAFWDFCPGLWLFQSFIYFAKVMSETLSLTNITFIFIRHRTYKKGYLM